MENDATTSSTDLIVAQRDDSRAAVDPDVILALSIMSSRTNMQVRDRDQNEEVR